MYSDQEHIVGSCRKCRILTEIQGNDSGCKCSECHETLVKTPSVANKITAEIDSCALPEHDVVYQCPECLQFAVRPQDAFPDVLWD